jgi:hypothetical protein
MKGKGTEQQRGKGGEGRGGEGGREGGREGGEGEREDTAPPPLMEIPGYAAAVQGSGKAMLEYGEEHQSMEQCSQDMARLRLLECGML